METLRGSVERAGLFRASGRRRFSRFHFKAIFIAGDGSAIKGEPNRKHADGAPEAVDGR